MSGDERTEYPSAPRKRVIEFEQGSTLTPEERAKLDFALEKHKEALMLLSS